MAIDWDTGEITSDQHILHPNQLTPVAKDMEVGQVTYMDADELAVSLDGSLWINPDAVLYPADEVPAVIDNMYFCRVIKTDQGYIVDASAGDYRLDPLESGDTVSIKTELDPAEEDWIPVVGLVSTDLERDRFGEILFEKYDIFLDKSVLVSLLEASSDDS